ncbi:MULTISPECIES: zinc ribbon-containing protein [Salinivibrio]|uniref:zinc ribbon-containing protein n=1 Tax=Salinivibrio TaxID=51366 RepID=UPI000988B480|nr:MULTISPECIES: zinc ribbon-containing protein [Salinivibrio]OOF10947.1 hypothetical protein BZG82_05830 [Salinivibrio sp. PR5]OOF32516.1 hypothetical protein BZJ20_01525 [Salinivibrio proteolyticus]
MNKEKDTQQSIIERVKDALENSPESLARWVELSEQYLKAAADLTKDEWALIEAYFKRDVKAFGAQYDKSQADEIDSEVFNDLIADTIWEQLAEITDRTQLEWREVFDDLQHQGVYEAGEIVGLGILQCEQCQHQTRHNRVDVIHPCVKCGHRFFTRRAYPA